jgi:transcriptional regulator with XRE-family HTH domain
MAFIGARLREARAARGLTQEQVAVRARIARTDVNRIENDGLSVGRQRLERIAAALDVSVLELQPEAEVDAPGLTLLRRLEEAEAALLALGPELQRLGDRAAPGRSVDSFHENINAQPSRQLAAFWSGLAALRQQLQSCAGGRAKFPRGGTPRGKNK